MASIWTRLAAWWRVRVRRRQPEAPRRINVFVSYAREDAAAVRQLVHDLKREGHAPWFAPHALRAGASIDDEVRRAIDAVPFVVVALSKAAAHSPWVSAEIRYALERQSARGGPQILPVYLASDDTPPALVRLKAVELRGAHYAAGLRELSDALHGRMPRGELPLAGFRAFLATLPDIDAALEQHLMSARIAALARERYVTPEPVLRDLKRLGIAQTPDQEQQHQRWLAIRDEQAQAARAELDQLLAATALPAETQAALRDQALQGAPCAALTPAQRQAIEQWLRLGPAREALGAAAWLFGARESGQVRPPMAINFLQTLRDKWQKLGDVAPEALPPLETWVDELVRLALIERDTASPHRQDDPHEVLAARRRFVYGRRLNDVCKAAWLYERAATDRWPSGRLDHLARE